MSKVTRSVNVYTIDGRVFEMDDYVPNLNRGIKIERYDASKVVRRQFIFNGKWIVCYENIFIGKEDEQEKENIDSNLEKIAPKVTINKDIVKQNEEHKTQTCCGEFSDMVNKGLILFRFDPFHVNPFDILSRNGETIQSGCTHCMFCGSKK